MNDISSKYHLLAREKNKIDSYLSKELAPVYADIALIERVIQNLLDTMQLSSHRKMDISL
jgi:K+-sensing histidine kinase KdpD